MRISTLQLHTAPLRQFAQHEAEIARAQEQIGTGTRITRPSDDPVGTARVTSLQQGISRLGQFERNATVATSRLGVLETALGEASNLLQGVREAAVQAYNATLTAADRRSLAIEVREFAAQLRAVANRTDDQGDYIFGGLRTDARPFLAGATGVFYNGDVGTRSLQVGDGVRVQTSEPGVAVFELTRDGNGSFSVLADASNTGTGIIAPGSVVDPQVYQSEAYRVTFTTPTSFDVVDDSTGTVVLAAQPYVDGGPILVGGIQTSISGTPEAGDTFRIAPSQPRSVFRIVDDLAAALESPGASAPDEAQVQQALQNSLDHLGGALEQVRAVHARVGTRLQSIETQTRSNEDQVFQATTEVADTAGLDQAEAISRMASRIQALESAQQSFVRIQNLSLFRLLR